MSNIIGTAIRHWRFSFRHRCGPMLRHWRVEGYNLILVARRKDRLDTLAKKLTARYVAQGGSSRCGILQKPDGIRSVEKLIAGRDDINVPSQQCRVLAHLGANGEGRPGCC